MVTLPKLGHTWVKEDDGFQAGIFIVIYLQLLEGQHQLVQDADGHTVHLHQLGAVPWDDVIIACSTQTITLLLLKLSWGDREFKM